MAPDGSAWEIDGVLYERNPAGAVPPWAIDMLTLWRAYAPPPGRIAGMAAGVIRSTGHLPEAGGAGEQAAIMLDAFECMTAAEAQIHAARER